MNDYLSRLLDRQWRGETPIRPRPGSLFESAPPVIPDMVPSVPEPAADLEAASHEPAPASIVPPPPQPKQPTGRGAPHVSPPAHDSNTPPAGQQRPATALSSVESPRTGERPSTAEASAPEEADQDIAEQPVFQRIRRTVVTTGAAMIEPDRVVTDARETRSADERSESSSTARAAEERREIPLPGPRAIRVSPRPPDFHPPSAATLEPAAPDAGGAESESAVAAPGRPASGIKPRITALPGEPPPIPAAQAPAIRVTIGRIEVRAVATPARAKPAPQRNRPSLSLDDYLKQRGPGR